MTCRPAVNVFRFPHHRASVGVGDRLQDSFDVTVAFSELISETGDFCVPVTAPPEGCRLVFGVPSVGVGSVGEEPLD